MSQEMTASRLGPHASRTPTRVPWVLKVLGLSAAAVAIVVVSTTVVGAVAVVHEGLLRVEVNEKGPGGARVNVALPAILVTGPMRIAPMVLPADCWGDAREDLVRIRPLLSGIAREMDRCPDGTLIEVRDGADHVVIRVTGGALRVDVETPSEDVHLALPLSILDAAADVLPRS